MIRNIIAKIAKETENKISNFKFNRRVCFILAAVITISSIGVGATKLGNVSNDVLALSDSKVPSATFASNTTPTQTTTNPLDVDLNYNGLCKVTIIKHAGDPQVVFVRQDTVRKTLEAAHTTVKRTDEINYKLSDRVFNGMSIIINKVTYKNDTISKKLTLDEFKKKYPKQSTSHLSENGKVLVSKTVEIKYINGKKAETKVKGFSYESCDVVIPSSYYGVETPGRKTVNNSKNNKKTTFFYSQLSTYSELTPDKDFQLDENGIPLNYSKKITGVASAYSCGTHTATGKRVQPGYIAVNPRQIPYGTKLFIRSSDGSYVYGYASAEDTGGFVSWGNTIADLFFWSESTCRQFGRRSIEIYVLD